MKRVISICICLLLFSPFVFSQDKKTDSLKAAVSGMADDSAKVNTLLILSRSYFNSDPDESIKYSKQAGELSVKLKFKKGEATALKNIGIVNYIQGRYSETVSYWNQSLTVFESIHDGVGVGNIYSNLGAVYDRLNDEIRAMDYYLKSLRISEQTGDTLRTATVLQNIGVLYQRKKGSSNNAIESYLKALILLEKLGDKDGIGTVSSNVGEIYLERDQQDSALYYFRKSEKVLANAVNLPLALNNIATVYRNQDKYDSALMYNRKAYELALKVNSKDYVSMSLIGLGKTYEKKRDNKGALASYKEAEKLATELNVHDDLKVVYTGLSSAYSKLGDYANAYKYQSLLGAVKDTLYNIESDKRLSLLQLDFEVQKDFDLQKKESQIKLLTKDKDLQDLELQRQKFAKNALIVGLLLVSIIIAILYRDYRAKARVNKLLDTQKAEIERLLENILPTEVAAELQHTGTSKPRYYESVSVLFTDFKNFTSHADKLSPQEVVEELNTCFSYFDQIMEKFGLEKIKTIGDSYMCAGGIPSLDPTHPYKIIKAALEIRDFMRNNNEKRKSSGLQPWELRIGVHVGPVVAGVVGRKKYAYDIWGSTVNVASRMESNGEPGHVNISASLYELVKDKYTCTHRGKIFAKNVGEVDMYFVDHEIIPGTPSALRNELGRTEMANEIEREEKHHSAAT